MQNCFIRSLISDPKLLQHVGNESVQPSKFDGLFLELFTSRDIKAQIRGEGHKRIDEDHEDRMFEFLKNASSGVILTSSSDPLFIAGLHVRHGSYFGGQEL